MSNSLKLTTIQTGAIGQLRQYPRPDGVHLRTLRKLVKFGLAKEVKDLPFEDGTVLDFGFELTCDGIDWLIADGAAPDDFLLNVENIVSSEVNDHIFALSEAAKAAVSKVAEEVVEVDIEDVPADVEEGIDEAEADCSTSRGRKATPVPPAATPNSSRAKALGLQKMEALRRLGAEGIDRFHCQALFALLEIPVGKNVIKLATAAGRREQRRGWPKGEVAEIPIEVLDVVRRVTAVMLDAREPAEADVLFLQRHHQPAEMLILRRPDGSETVLVGNLRTYDRSGLKDLLGTVEFGEEAPKAEG